MKKIIPINKYQRQQGDRVVGYTYYPRLRKLFYFLARHYFVIGVLILVALIYRAWNTDTTQSITKLEIDTKIEKRYEEIYRERFEFDELNITQEEEKKMQNRIENRLEQVRKEYWAEAKKDILTGVKEYIEASPEVTPLLVDISESKDLEFTAQNKYNNLDNYLKAYYPDSPLIGMDILKICKESNITAWQCRLGLAIMKHESRYGTAYAGGSAHLGSSYNNYGGVKCDTRLSKIKPCKFPDKNGMWITEFNSPKSFLKYFFEQIIGKNWGVCKTTACMSPKYVSPMNKRNYNWENKINSEILNLHFINY